MAWLTHSPDIVIFGIIPWGPRWQRPHHFSQQLAGRGHRIVYVTPHLALDGDTWRDLGSDQRIEALSLAQLTAREKDSIHSASEWTEEDLGRAHHGFRQMVDALRLRAPILFTQSPGWWPLLSYIRERSGFRIVYDCLDEHTGWNHEMGAMLRTWEERLATAADLVLASAAGLCSRLAQHAPSVRLVPNGCDAAHFAEAAEPNGILRSVRPGPVIGYYGALTAGWFDTVLLVSLAEARPDWNIVLIGPADEDVQAQLECSPNVLLLGEMPYAELPRYCADFDVAIIPFLVNDLTAATDPVKLYEYFAAGKPVVTTPLPAVYEMQGLLRIAEDASSFEQAVAGFLERPGDALARAGVAHAASWGRRVESFYQELLGRLPTLDVVVVVAAWSEGVRRCIESICSDRSYAATLLVLVSSESRVVPSYIEALEADGRLLVVRAGEATGDAALEAATRTGHGEYVLVVRDEVELPRGTLLGLVNALMRSPGIGSAGARNDLLDIAGKRYQPAFASVDAQASFFGEHAWAHFGAEADGAGVRCPVVVFRRDDLGSAHGSAGAAAERARDAAKTKQAVVVEGILVHKLSNGDTASVDPVVYRALSSRARRQRLLGPARGTVV